MGKKGGEDLLLTGWLDSEDWGTWAIGNTAQWTFRTIERPAGSSVRVSGVATGYPSGGEIVAHVFMGSTAVAELRFVGEQKEQPWTFLVPAGLIGSDNILSLRMEMSPDQGLMQPRLGMKKFRTAYE
jgi:hypothetical protein